MELKSKPKVRVWRFIHWWVHIVKGRDITEEEYIKIREKF